MPHLPHPDDTPPPPVPPGEGLTFEHVARAVQQSGIAVWHLDLASDRISGNEHFFHILGLEPQAHAMDAARIRALQHPDDQAQSCALTERLLKEGKPQESRMRYRRTDGRVVHLLSRRSLLHDSAGRPSAILGVTLDVTERDAQEQRGLENARRVELIARAAGIGWWSLEGEPGQIRWNAQLREMVGLGADEPLPDLKSWIDRFVHTDDREPVRDHLRAWQREGRTALKFSFRLCTTSGQLREVVSHAVFEPRGAAPLRFGMIIDVTEQTRAAQRLHEARERAALAADGAGIGTWEWAPARNVALWDANMFRLRGLEPGTEVPSHAHRLSIVHPEDREMVAESLTKALAQRTPLSLEFRVVWPDGQVRWLASRSVDLTDAETGEVHRIGANWDITDRREAERARREAELAVRESQAKSRFLARMSHELRTPLNAVLGFTQLLLTAPPDKTPGPALTREQSLQHIQQAGRHLLTLVNDVLDLAGIEGGEVALERAPVALDTLVGEALDLVSPQARQASVRLSHRTPALRVLADATRLRQVLLNLLSNAIKYNRAGGEVVVDAVPSGREIHLRVRDDGRGIPHDRLAELFQPFSRLGAEHEAIEGTGIGLAIVKSLVEQMGGRVAVESSPGVGSVFEVVLPAADDSDATQANALAPPPADTHGAGRPRASSATASSAPTAAASPSPCRPWRVLYIEDNAVNALIVRELLGTVPGYELVVAGDGGSGLRHARQHLPDLVLLDMQLPDMDGLEVLRELRASPHTAQVPVVALSANAMPEQVQRGLAAGLTDYWTKPLDMPRFLQQLGALLPRTG